jgi:pimeloyl-ACP methyl ester carboxylesterase
MLHAPALVIDAVVDSAPQLFPLWPRLDGAQRTAARTFATALRRWAAAERARVARELPQARVLELHGANHYVFESNPREVGQAMRAFLAGEPGELRAP